jgi:antitoxin Phd
MKKWTLHEAKNKFSQVVDEASQNPQLITRRGVDSAIVISVKKYKELQQQQKNFKDLLRSNPDDFVIPRIDIKIRKREDEILA